MVLGPVVEQQSGISCPAVSKYKLILYKRQVIQLTAQSYINKKDNEYWDVELMMMLLLFPLVWRQLLRLLRVKKKRRKMARMK